MKSTINLWDNLPEEIIHIIWEYNHIPFLEEIKTFKFNPTKFSNWRKDWIRHPYDIYRIIDFLRRNSFWDWFGRHDREIVIIRMKENKLRVRRGMKTRTMIKHLTKL